MSAITANKNRWGDPPMVAQGRLWPPAIVAFALAIVTALVAVLATCLAAAGPGLQSTRVLFVLLLIVQFSLAQVPIVTAYVVLCICRPGRSLHGRGLAWAALGLAYVSLIWHLTLAAAAISQLTSIALLLMAAGIVHLPLFAAESRFAKNAVATLVFGGTFLSLLFPWLHYTREQARRLQCQYNLHQMGVQLQETVSSSAARDLRFPATWAPSDETLASSSLFQWITESSQSAPNRYAIPAGPFGVSDPPGAFHEPLNGKPLPNTVTP